MTLIREAWALSCTPGLTVPRGQLVVGFCNKIPEFPVEKQRACLPPTSNWFVERSMGLSRRSARSCMRYQRPIYGLIARMVRDPGRAEELAQDTFVKAFRALHTYDVQRKFSAWLLTIAHHVAIDELRKCSLDTEPLEQTTEDGERTREFADTQGADAGRACRAGPARDGAADGDRPAPAGVSRSRHAALRARARLRRDCGDYGTADGHGEELASSRAKRAGGASGEPGMERDNPLDDVSDERAARAVHERGCALRRRPISSRGRCGPSCASRCRPDARRFEIRWRRCSGGRPSSLRVALSVLAVALTQPIVASSFSRLITRRRRHGRVADAVHAARRCGCWTCWRRPGSRCREPSRRRKERPAWC